jgi:pimeloyl-ACP methyl ester carboxylesterase
MGSVVKLGTRVGQSPLAIVVTAVAALGATAILNQFLARKAERNNPPKGRFVEVDGVRLHYCERGSGEPLVLLHGNGSMIEDFESSGLVERAARKYRVIVFDRPGFGHSSRPRTTIWTPETQAELFYLALRRLGVRQAKILGHSWGASVALALALRHPKAVSGLVLASGYYYPTPRADVALSSLPAVPVIGDLLAHTVSPIIARLIWPSLMRKIFGPAAMPRKFRGFSKEMAVRPTQLRASAAEAALMIPGALALQGEYKNLKVPLIIVAGDSDRFISTAKQSARLHQEICGSDFRSVAGAGHMVHQTATEEVIAAVDALVTNTPDQVMSPAASR